MTSLCNQVAQSNCCPSVRASLADQYSHLTQHRIHGTLLPSVYSGPLVSPHIKGILTPNRQEQVFVRKDDVTMKRSVLRLLFLVSAISAAQMPRLAAQVSARANSTTTPAAQTAPQADSQAVSSPPAVVPALPVPRLLKFSGVVKDDAGSPRTGVVGLSFSVYKDQQGGSALWMETQNAELDAQGNYTVLLGSTKSEGMPLDLFSTGESRWLGVKVELNNEAEQARVLLVSVPYALKASDSDTLGGKPASAYLLATEATSGTVSTQAAAQSAAGATTSSTGGAKNAAPPTTTSNYIPMFTSSSGALGNSALYQATNGNIGIGFTSPNAKLLIAAPTGGAVLNATNLNDQDMQIILSTPGASDKHTYFGTSTTTNLTLGVGGTEKMRITNAGNVGIGYSSPTNARVVIGAPVGGAVINSSNLVDQDMFITLSAPGASDKHAYFGPSTPTNLTLGVASTEMMRITNAGRVGIGTSTPAATLDVNGSVNASSFTSTNGFGGSSPTGFGVYGDSITPYPGSAGVLGYTGTSFSTTYLTEAGIATAGVWSDSSAAGSGVPVSLFATGDDVYAAAFINSGADYPAVFVDNSSGTALEAEAATGYGVSASTSSGTGVYGGTSSGGDGVEGYSSGLSSQQAGVLGVGNTASGTYGAYNIYSGVWGDTGTSSTTVSPAWAIGVLGTADDGHAGVFLNNSSSWATMYVGNSGTGGTGLFKTLTASTPTGTCGFGGNGDLTCTGQVKTLASTNGGARKLETYAMQSPENWMEDFGSGTLQSGVAVVNIDPAFEETVSQSADYHVFITPNGDSKGLYVSRKSAGSFEVHESSGGTSSLSFDYRIVAKRRGYEAQRLTDVTERFNAEQRPLNRLKGQATAAPSRPAPSPLLPKTHSTPTKRLPPGAQNSAARKVASAIHP